MITGKELIEWGFKSGSWFKEAIAQANELQRCGFTEDAIINYLNVIKPQPLLMRDEPINYAVFLDAECQTSIDNKTQVIEAMDVLARLPTVEDLVVMPDACPAGIIPVGAVVVTDNTIHPGFHSADICCSVMISYFNSKDITAEELLLKAREHSKFGPGKRAVNYTRQFHEVDLIIRQFADNPFLEGLEDIAEQHFLTQGDGNHFIFVGKSEKTGMLCLVTHFGSRGLGSQLYRRGMQAAIKYTKAISPDTPKEASWLSMRDSLGIQYWDALQLVRDWTYQNHYQLHNLIAKKLDITISRNFWNEHNFVFEGDEGKFFHAKGSTPMRPGVDSIIPLNMAHPVLIVSQNDNNEDALGFAPHGAGRNYSRAEHMRRLGEMSEAEKLEVFERETEGIHAISYSGQHDLTELPSAYKSAYEVESQINKYQLANIEDRIIPYGSIMAGKIEWSKRN